MMTVNGTTNIPKVMPRYETSIAWAGDTASSLAAFVLYNIHPRAEGTVDFGIHLEFGHRYNPLMDSVRIRVKEKDWYNIVLLFTVKSDLEISHN